MLLTTQGGYPFKKNTIIQLKVINKFNTKKTGRRPISVIGGMPKNKNRNKNSPTGRRPHERETD